MKGPYVPERGDLVWLDFSPQAGREQAGPRPALVISPREYNSLTGLGVFCPITSKVKGYPFEVKLPERGPVRGVVLSDHLKNLDWRSRRVSFKAKAEHRVIEEVIHRISALLLAV